MRYTLSHLKTEQNFIAIEMNVLMDILVAFGLMSISCRKNFVLCKASKKFLGAFFQTKTVLFSIRFNLYTKSLSIEGNPSNLLVKKITEVLDKVFLLLEESEILIVTVKGSMALVDSMFVGCPGLDSPLRVRKLTVFRKTFPIGQPLCTLKHIAFIVFRLNKSKRIHSSVLLSPDVKDVLFYDIGHRCPAQNLILTPNIIHS